ncbi:MAG: 3'-5' exonuclease [Verrucomicrobiota bacterium]
MPSKLKRARQTGRQPEADAGNGVAGIKRFAAIDFETADYGQDSACALSVVVAEPTGILRTEHWLIKPPRQQFFFTHIHGITWRDVMSKPCFGDIWREAALLLEGVDFVAAHNARFDKGVLRACCTSHSVAPPPLPFVCTVKLARKAWNIRPTTLPDVCRKFSIPLRHHDALSDARACAQIVIEAIKAEFNPMVAV